ncbi:plasmid-related protein [Niveibacterium sp.]|uniref:plasmid-related protein n=1 Tax=Niveibacterium sp. TaxID=2017444 RepID=UPI0035B2AEC7
MLRKDAGLRIRVDRDLREAFVEACRSHDMAASEVLREFMRSYTQQANSQAGQLPLPLNKENDFK